MTTTHENSSLAYEAIALISNVQVHFADAADLLFACHNGLADKERCRRLCGALPIALRLVQDCHDELLKLGLEANAASVRLFLRRAERLTYLLVKRLDRKPTLENDSEVLGDILTCAGVAGVAQGRLLP